jgi:2-dehydro-3-deoxygalactonokinase
MCNYITIDGGTTNTRVRLVLDGAIAASETIRLGNKDCVDGNGALKAALRENIAGLLSRCGLSESSLRAVLASGMITSEYGLHEVPHIAAPAGIAELHAAMARASIPEITSVPFYFIPGIKTDSDILDDADVMRGEETEIIGLIEDGLADHVYVLPGSHSKHIFPDDMGRIAAFRTMMTGEMISAIAENTILKGAVRLDLFGFNPPFLLMGYDYCAENGINNALFKTRILKTIFKRNALEIYSYFLGVILAQEIAALKDCGRKGALIGGRSQIKNAMAYILRARTDLNVICASDEAVDGCVPRGAIKIFEYTP